MTADRQTPRQRRNARTILWAATRQCLAMSALIMIFVNQEAIRPPWALPPPNAMTVIWVSPSATQRRCPLLS